MKKASRKFKSKAELLDEKIARDKRKMKIIQFRLKKTHDQVKSIQNKELSDLRPKKTVNE